MTRPELRVFLQKWFCGCGDPTAATTRLRDILKLHPLYNHRDEFEALVPDNGLQYLLLYTLHHFDLTEHGGTVGGAWLTDKGKAVLEALNRESVDDFQELLEQSCVHGYSVESGDELMQCEECSALNPVAERPAP